MDQVWEDSAPVTITRVGGKNVVVVSEEDFNGLVETVHLLESSNNAKRLMESIAQFEAGHTFKRKTKDGAKERLKKRAKRTGS
jgi:Antitoxin of toxin-antitoxin stability system